MFDCFYYWLIAPTRGGVIDVEGRIPAFDMNIKSLDEREIKLSLFCDDRNTPHFFRVTIPNLESEELPASILPTIQILKEHSLTILRLTYRHDTSLAIVPEIWSFLPKGRPLAFGLEIQEYGEVQYDPTVTQHLFFQSMDTREHLRLYADGLDGRIPIQYRFLSLYKLFELIYRDKGIWRKEEFEGVVSKYSDNFIAVGIFDNFLSKIHAYRDKCAHIRTGGKNTNQVMGVTHLRLKDAKLVEQMLPILVAIAASAINSITMGKYQLVENVELAQ
jgi:hypothetical protein